MLSLLPFQNTGYPYRISLLSPVLAVAARVSVQQEKESKVFDQFLTRHPCLVARLSRLAPLAPKIKQSAARQRAAPARTGSYGISEI